MGLPWLLTCIGLVREILGSGAIFGNVVVPEDYHIAIFVLAPGAFFVLAILTALQNKFKAPSATNGSVATVQAGLRRQLYVMYRFCLHG